MLRKWTPEKRAEVLEYRKTHSARETLLRFKISSGQLYQFQHPGYYNKRKQHKANGAANGLATLPQKDALMWLERWRAAYFDRLKAETPSAQSVLTALRDGK